MNFKCWNCGQDHDIMAKIEDLRSAYDAGYRKGMDHMRKAMLDNSFNKGNVNDQGS